MKLDIKHIYMFYSPVPPNSNSFPLKEKSNKTYWLLWQNEQKFFVKNFAILIGLVQDGF